MIWSWSRVNSFFLGMKGEGCLYSWYKAYIEGDRGKGNWFSSVGTVTHDILEQYTQGKLSPWDVAEAFTQAFVAIEDKPVSNRMSESYYNKLYDFFNGELFNTFFDDATTLEQEDEKEFNVGNYKFKGFPDLAIEHKKYGLCVVDYKTAKPYGDWKEPYMNSLQHNIQQLYLYSIPIKETYSDYPDNLIYLHPRHEELVVVPFNMDDLKRTEEWCVDTIETAGKWNDWVARCELELKDTFYQKFLCSHRFNCEHMK